MTLSEGALYTVRVWVGDEPTTTELDAAFLFAGSLKRLVWGILRRRLTEFELDPASFSAVSGLYTQNAAANIDALQKDLARLEREPDNLGWDDSTGSMDPLAGLASQKVRRLGYRR